MLRLIEVQFSKSKRAANTMLNKIYMTLENECVLLYGKSIKNK